MNASYSFGKRLSSGSKLLNVMHFYVTILLVWRKDCSPGPVYFIDSMFSRNGREGKPAYTILGRQKDLSKCNKSIMLLLEFLNVSHSIDTFKTPSPGDYNSEKAHPQGEKHAPAYSMGSRTRYRKSTLHNTTTLTLICLILQETATHHQTHTLYPL